MSIIAVVWTPEGIAYAAETRETITGKNHQYLNHDAANTDLHKRRVDFEV